MVTHDPVDAYALADRVVVVEHGRVVQEGTIADVTAHPRSRYVAELVGLNLIEGAMRASPDPGTLRVPGGGEVVVAGASIDGPALVVIRPQAVALHRNRPEGSARNVWRLRVDDVDERADRTRVALVGAVPLVAEITFGALHELALRPGEEVWATVKATDITAYPA
jgi:molybdate transport system ATP-binding protein